MLDTDARYGRLPVIGRVALWLMLPLVAGGLTASPAASVPAGLTKPIVLPLPAAPTGVTATATDGQAEVSWTAPRPQGGDQINRYVVASSPSSTPVIVTGGQTSALMNGLTNGERFTFTVAAADSDGFGPSSVPSNGVVPESLSSYVSTVSIRSVNAMFNGGACLDQGTQCFGIQQNSFVRTDTNAEYWIQNLVFVEDSPDHGWEAEGNYEIWSGNQQSILGCSGTIVSGPHGAFCVWPIAWRQLKFPARINLASTVSDGDVLLSNSLGNVFPAWSPGTGTGTGTGPGPGAVQFIVDLHEAAVPSMLSLYAPETVIVGETGRHTATFIGGSGSIASQMVLANGRVGDPDTQCVAQSSDTSTGEASVGFYWYPASRDGASLVDFTAHGGRPGDGDGVKVLPGSQLCS
jgi:hypothetical protein